MKIEKMALKDREKLLEYLGPYEKFCILLYSEITRNSPSVYIVKGNFGEIHGVFSWWKGSSIHHCLPEVYGKNRDEMERAFTEFFQEMSLQFLFSIVGEKAGTNLLEEVLINAFDKKPAYRIHNKLMENGRFDSKKNLLGANRQLIVSSAKPEEVEKLYPLQLEYEKEEVTIPDHQLDEDACYAKLENYVEAGAVYTGKINGVIICKATVTARAKNFALLGGVYTVPKYRKHGLAKTLVNTVSEALLKEQIRLTLFVKTTNMPAIKLYEDCGFKAVCDWEILYY